MRVPPGRAVLIAGCSSGIGYACALGLKTRGYRVLATARRPADVSRLQDEGLEALVLDVSDPDCVARAAGQALERTGGRLYALFNNAGYGQPGAVEDLRREVLREQLETNLLGAHDLTCRLLPAMREHGEGRIVQNSSVLGLVALRYRGAYNASKFALEGLSDTLRLELAGSGVHVSLIEPGPIRSRFRENAYAAFLRHVDPHRSAHRAQYRAMVGRLTAAGAVAPFTLGPEAVLSKLVHALEARRPRPRYYVTVPTYAFAALKRLLPAAWLDALLLGVSRRETRGG